MSLDSGNALDQDTSLEDAILSYLKAKEAGEVPDRQEWLARHGDVAAQLEEFFATQERLDPVLAPLRYLGSAALAAGPAMGPCKSSHDTDPNATVGSHDTDPNATVGSQDASPQVYHGIGSQTLELPAKGLEPLPTIRGYEVLQVLGQGGMGIVFKARQVALKRLVALKMIRGTYVDAEQLARFRIEGEAAARLQHPNIVQIYQVGEQDGQPFFSLEFIDGGSLKEILGGTPLTAERAARIAEPLARAMHYAHQRGIIHRDLKPANILLQKDEGGRMKDESDRSASSLIPPLSSFIPKIADFGLAKQLDEDQCQTQSGAIMGTPSYMPPEQAQGHRGAVGPPADVYALGAILYEMLTGRPPFKGTTPLDTVSLVVTEEPVPPSRLQPKVPRDLETICLKCLHKEPAKRYASAEAMAEDLRRFLAREPILARPVGVWERTVKWVRRRPAAAASVGATLLAACALVALIALYAVYQGQQTDVYKQQLQKVQQQQEVRERSSQTLFQAQKLEAAGQLQAAYTELAKAEEALNSQPDLLANDLRTEVRKRLSLVGASLREQEQGRQAKKRRDDFQGPYDDALSYHTYFTGLDRDTARTKTRTAVRTALALYGLDRDPDPAERVPTVLERERPYLSAEEHSLLARECYELLLIWAETEAEAPSGQAEPEAQGRDRARQALALLARAARLGQAYGLETRTYHVRLARYTARSRGEALDPAAFDRAVPAQPLGELDWFLEALEHYRGGQYEPARQACREVLREQEGHFWARYLQALCNLRLRRWASAKADLTMCITRRPEFAWPRVQRGFAASELGFSQTKDAELAGDEFLAAEVDFALALAHKRDPVLRYVALVNRGVLNIHRQRWPQALVDLRQAVELQPERYEGYVNVAQALRGAWWLEEVEKVVAAVANPWAQALRGAGRLDEAAAALDQAVARAPHLAEVYESRAKLHLLRRHWAAARADFEQAIRREPKDSESNRLVNNLVELGKLLHHEGNDPAALARYDRALELKPKFVLTERFRAEALLALERLEEAGQALDKYLSVTPEAAPNVYQARGLIHAQRKQLPAAIEMYTLALRQNPQDLVTRRYRGWTYLQTDSVRLALEDFEASLRQDPVNADALTGRGNARIRLRLLDEALDDAQAAEQHGPLTDRLWYELTRLYAQAGAQLEAEIRAPRPAAATLAARRMARCRAKALECLNETLEELPQDRRAAFWRNQVQNDPALTAIRRERLYGELAARYGGTGS